MRVRVSPSGHPAITSPPCTSAHGTLTIAVRVCQIKIGHAYDHTPGTAPMVADQGGGVPEAEP